MERDEGALDTTLTETEGEGPLRPNKRRRADAELPVLSPAEVDDAVAVLPMDLELPLEHHLIESLAREHRLESLGTLEFVRGPDADNVRERRVACTFSHRTHDPPTMRTLHFIQLVEPSAAPLPIDSFLWVGSGRSSLSAFNVVRRSEAADVVATSGTAPSVRTVLSNTSSIERLFGNANGTKYRKPTHDFLVHFTGLLTAWLRDAYAHNSTDYVVALACDSGLERSVTALALLITLAHALQVHASGQDLRKALFDPEANPLTALLDEVATAIDSGVVAAIRQLPVLLAVSGAYPEPRRAVSLQHHRVLAALQLRWCAGPRCRKVSRYQCPVTRRGFCSPNCHSAHLVALFRV